MVKSWCRAGEIEPHPPAGSVSSGSDQAQASPTSAMEPGVSGSGKVQTAALVFSQINASPTAGFAVNMSRWIRNCEGVRTVGIGMILWILLFVLRVIACM
ncbi:hypothetical protein KFK09_016673 [Dendrobium nobile]|uniref:Uncharacterized protein n=1 Tax=Dendrobium nobile TaxID=94219 RepID=A0A8T3B0N5_DENNO|nr:hypothetical protein KFK09_016673 [Dendrobium nobile]